MEKMTNVKALNYVLENVADLPEDVKEKVTAIRDGFVKKAENKKPTKVQVENVAIADKIIEYLGTVEQATATEIMNNVEGVTSTQKAVALLKPLIPNKVVKVADKKKVFYKLAQ